MKITIVRYFVLCIYAIFSLNMLFNQSADPGQPTQLKYFTVFKSETEFGIRWNPPTTGSVDKYSITVECNYCSCTPNYEHLVKETTVNVTGLYAGTDCIVQVAAILGNLSSVPLVYKNIETKEKGNDIYT